MAEDKKSSTKTKEKEKDKDKAGKGKKESRQLGWGLAEKARRSIKNRADQIDKAINPDG